MEPTRVGLVGAGRIAGVHADAYKSISEATVVCVIDPDIERARQIAKRFGASSYTDIDQAIQNERMDAIDICTPTDTHEKLVLASFEAGLHVSCQKPFALTLESCDRMIEASKQFERILIVPYMSRHAPIPVMAKELIETGRIGTPLNAHYHMLCPASVATTPWFRQEECSGGIIVDTLTHGLDLFNWYFGRVEAITGLEYVNKADGASAPDRDDACVMLGHAGGTHATLRVSWSAPATYPMVMVDIIGTEGAIRIETPSAAVSYQKMILYSNNETTQWESAGRGHDEKTAYFISVVRGQQPLGLSNPNDAREALRLSLAARKAARAREWVAL